MPKNYFFQSSHIHTQGIKLISVDKIHEKKSAASDPEYDEWYKSPDNPYNNHLFKIHTMKYLKLFTSTKCGHGKKNTSLKRKNMAKHYACSRFPETIQQDTNTLQKVLNGFGF